jgi:hypothetical protein
MMMAMRRGDSTEKEERKKMHFYYAHICVWFLDLETDLVQLVSGRFGGVVNVNERIAQFWTGGDGGEMKWG